MARYEAGGVVGRGRMAILGIVAIAGGALVPAGGARAQAVVHEVEFGQPLEGVQGEVLAALPRSLRVHSGDIIHLHNDFTPGNGVIHWGAFLPAPYSPKRWMADHGRMPDGPWAMFVLDPDERPEVASAAWKDNNRMIFPSDPQCGESVHNPCEFDASGDGDDGVLGSGLGWGIEASLDYYVRVDAEPGTVFWALCPYHPTVQLRVEVVAPGEPVTAADDSAARNAAYVAAQEKKARALHEKHLSVQRSHPGPGGTRRWEAHAGIADGPLFLMDMYPKTLSISRDDRVRWEFGRGEVHTVTFPLETALSEPWSSAKCDLDTDAGSAEDVDALPVRPFCPGGPLQVEFDLSHLFPLPIGNGTFSAGDDFETSGVRSRGWPGLPGAYELDFPKGGTFGYACMLHPQMRGTVVVR